MTAGENGWYTAEVPVWVNSVIINANGGEVQTEDLTIDAAEVWVTVDSEGAAEFTYNDPDAPVAEDITVYVQAPADWSEPHLWHGPRRMVQMHFLHGRAKPCRMRAMDGFH